MEDKEDPGVQVSETPKDASSDNSLTETKITDPFLEKVAGTIAHKNETPLKAFQRSLENYTDVNTRGEILAKTTAKVFKEGEGGEEETQDNLANKSRRIS